MTETALMTSDDEILLQKINISVYDRKYESKVINFLLLVVIMGAIFIIGAFWSTETLLWNRIKYGTGSLWQNNLPKYHVDQGYSVTDMVRLLWLNFGIYLVGELIVIFVSLYILYNSLIKNTWNNEFKILSITEGILSGLGLFLNFWLYQSIKVIASLEGTINEIQSGYDWIRVDIGGFSLFTEVVVVILMILNLISFFGNFYLIISQSSKSKEILRIMVISLFFLLLLFNFLAIQDLIQFYREEYLQESDSHNYNLWISLMIGIGLLIGDFILVKRSIPKEEGNLLVIALKLVKASPFYIVLIAYLIFSLFPVYIVFKVSFSSYQEILLGVEPGSPLYSSILNYSSVMFAVSLDEPSFSGALFRSFGIGIGTGLIGITVSVTAAYALARFKFKGNSFLTFLILTTQMFPGIILLLPQYIIWASLGFVDTFGGLLLASSVGTTAYVTWMMKGYFETIPVDIEEAAIMDGSSRVGNFAKIAFPLARSGLVAVLIFTFLSAWQDFVLARTLLRDPNNFTLPLLASNFENSQDQSPFFELLAPYAILVALPVVLFFIFMQKDLAKGAVAGSVK
ncbi:MAG: carbohydrate ABC transporter permease [Promethearchaeota archaeon]